MKIKIKIVSSDGQLPKKFDTFGEATFDIENLTSFDLLCSIIGIQNNEHYIVLHNDSPILPLNHNSLMLNDGDLISIFPPLEGG